MAETLKQIGIRVTRPDASPRFRVTTSISASEDFSSEHDARGAYDTRRASLPTLATGVLTVGAAVFLINEAREALQANPQSLDHLTKAILGTGTALYFGSLFAREKGNREVAQLQAKALLNADQSGDPDHETVFPMEPKARVLAAIDSWQAEGKSPTLYEISKRDAELRSTDPHPLPTADRIVNKALAQLAKERVIRANKKVLPLDPRSKRSNIRYEYSIIVPQSDQLQSAS